MTILAIAYACEPDEGSEPGAGWALARCLARMDHTVVITRANNQTPIEAGLPRCPERDRLEFVYVDLPKWMRFWKKGKRGLRLYYLLWQVAVLRRARSLHRTRRLDLVWHLTIANAWLGSVGGLVGPPFVYGPVGGGVKPPRPLLMSLGAKGLAYEFARGATRTIARYLNPLARLGWRRARLILVQNRETGEWMPSRYGSKIEVFPNAFIDDDPAPVDGSTATERSRDNVALFAGRLLAWKGCSLAVDALEHLPEWRLIVCGRGPDERRLRARAVKRGVDDRVEFRGWLPREELMTLMKTRADVFLFPSLHDEAGWVVYEARACGIPTVCLDVGGPPLLGGRAVSPARPPATARRLAQRLETEAGSTVEAPPTFRRRADDLRDLLVVRGLQANFGSAAGTAVERAGN
jgi:glycosyltransferase involved in cell wall biosynthesis